MRSDQDVLVVDAGNCVAILIHHPMGTLFPRPNEVIIATEILAYIITFVSIACYAILVWVVAKKSPRAMGAYRW